MAAAMSAHQQKAARRVVRALRADMPGLLDKVVKRIHSEIPLYAAEDVVPADDLRTSVGNNVDWGARRPDR